VIGDVLSAIGFAAMLLIIAAIMDDMKKPSRMRIAGIVTILSLATATAAPSTSLWRHWAVATEAANSDSSRVVFTLIGTTVSQKLPILVLAFHENSWTAMLTCGEPLKRGTAANICLDGQPEKSNWKMSSDHTATFAVTPERFIVRLLDCRALEVVFPLPDESRHATFDLTGLEKEIDNFPQAKKALTLKSMKPRETTAAGLLALQPLRSR
jgi:hypothetical protein